VRSFGVRYFVFPVTTSGDSMIWWGWIVLGLGLLLAELATPGGFYLFFFGISSLLVGLLDVFGIAAPAWMQWFLFTVLALITLKLFRKPLLRRFREPEGRVVDSLLGEPAVALEEIPPGAMGKAELRGSAWNARNAGDTPIAKGRRCKVERVEGLTLEIRC
jgi:inner membrane protein